ncbi:hypothetical protein V6N12_052145 [Hibiscus sabdariffa]|uniref:Uncharacterized protein n=1 Tax=Hibiscus sabdariffa TaxID=183260 RepID=A0ABR2GHD5_9ROSI
MFEEDGRCCRGRAMVCVWTKKKRSSSKIGGARLGRVMLFCAAYPMGFANVRRSSLLMTLCVLGQEELADVLCELLADGS